MSESAYLTRARERVSQILSESGLVSRADIMQDLHLPAVEEFCALLTQVRNEALASAEQDNKRLREALTNLLADAEYPRRSQSHIDAARAALKTGEQAL